MKGLMFNLLEDFISESLGEKQYLKIIENEKLIMSEPQLIVGPGSYPDEDFTTILNVAARELQKTEVETIEEFGKFALPHLAERYPHFFNRFSHPRDLLRNVAHIHHVEIKKLYKDAKTPDFTISEPDQTTMVLQYISTRNLCTLVAGLIDGLSEYYETAINHTQHKCILNNDNVCEFVLTFPEK